MSNLRYIAMILPIALSLLAYMQFVECAMSPTSSRIEKQYFSSASSPPSLPSIEVYQVSRENVNSVNNDIGLSKQESSTFQRINASKNSDLLFGEVTERDSALLLHCQASYSIQWIFRGDSDPEFNTNTTTKMDSTGNKIYSAYLFLGSRRNLNERETGKYICTSVRNKKFSSYFYIYVTNSALFTNKGLETIYYSGKDDYIRIPCSLSEPRATATLQKSENGVLKCPMNDSVRFDAKEGFILNPKRLEKPDGTYLCIADYNNTFQIIKYNVMRDDGPNSGSGTEQTSDEFDQPPNSPTQSPTPPTQQSTPPSIHDPPSSGSSDAGCSNIKCGDNAFCRLTKKREAVCRCREGYIGNPYVECKHQYEMTTQPPPPPNQDSTNYPPPQSSSSSSSYLCGSYDDCPNDRACLENVCENPCYVNSICGPNTNCETQYHTPFCRCNEGYEGDPYSSQEGQQCEKSSYCEPNPCGPNSVCKYVNGIISCSCKPGYGTNNDGTCHPNLKKGLKPLSLSRHPTLPLPRPIVIKNATSSGGLGKECRFDIDCPDDKMCIQDKCENPCVNACGSGAVCHIRNHFPRCLCPEGTTGDPFYKCVPLFSELIGSSTVNPPQQINGNTDKSKGVDCGGEHSPCGPNTLCQASRGHFVCACPNNFAGDPYSTEGCARKEGYLKCDKDPDCPHFLTCLRHQGCVNPCNVKNVCHDGRSCVPFLHRPACLKTDNINVDLPRDGLASDKENEDQLDISEIPEGLNSTSCFIKKDGEIISPCGKNTVCYDETSIVGNNTLAGTAFCGCMENYVGDPYTACELLQTCTSTNTSNCTEQEKCEGGFCRHMPVYVTLGRSNPCFPSPCTKSDEVCIIIRSNNSAKCFSSLEINSPTNLKTQEEQPSINLFRSDVCELTGLCEKEDDDAENEGGGGGDSTTEIVGDFTDFPTTATSASYMSSAAVVSSLEQGNVNALKHLSEYSNETTPPVFNDFSSEDTVVDV